MKDALEADDLSPIIAGLVGDISQAPTAAQRARFLEIFTDDDSGVLETREFKLLMRFCHALAHGSDARDNSAEGAAAAADSSPSASAAAELSELRDTVDDMARMLAADYDAKEAAALDLEQTKTELHNTTVALHQMRRDFDALLEQLVEFAGKAHDRDMRPRRMKSLGDRLARVLSGEDAPLPSPGGGGGAAAAGLDEASTRNGQSPAALGDAALRGASPTNKTSTSNEPNSPYSPMMITRQKTGDLETAIFRQKSDVRETSTIFRMKTGEFETVKPTTLWSSADLANHVRKMGSEFEAAADIMENELQLDGEKLLGIDNESLPEVIIKAGVPETLHAQLLVELRVLKGML